MSRSAWRIAASGFGAGLSPFAPGSAGTLVAVPLAWVWERLPVPIHLVLLLALLPVAALVCGRAAAAAGAHDPGWIVLDEMVGFWFAVALVPPSFAVYGAGFVLFRLFDILKPPPIGWLDRAVPGGWGILLDDVAAGLCTRLALGFLSGLGVL